MIINVFKINYIILCIITMKKLGGISPLAASLQRTIVIYYYCMIEILLFNYTKFIYIYIYT